MDSEQKRKRVKVLETALLFENLVSSFLALLLDIDVENSKTLGNSSSSISFNNKVDLLLDIKTIDKATKTKFTSFMNMRNQFMHNIKATSFNDCINKINGLEKWLLKTYPQDEDILIEQRLENCFDKLVFDLFQAITNVANVLKEKVLKEADHKSNEFALKSLIKSIVDCAKVFDEILPNHDPKLKGMGKLFNTLLQQRYKTLLDEDYSSEFNKSTKEIAFEDFDKVDLRMGTIISAEDVDGWGDYLKVIIDFSFAKMQSVIKKGKNFDVSKVLNQTVCAVINVGDLPVFRGKEIECRVLSSENKEGEISLMYATNNTIGKSVK